MVLVHVCFFTLTKLAKNQGQKLEQWQNHNNSNGKLALKHIVPFLTENDPCRIPSHVPGQRLWFSTCFPLVDLINRETYCHISSFILCGLRREFPKYFQHTQKYICFTGQSVLVKGKLTQEGGNGVKFSISICLGVGVGARETRLSHNMTLGWKTERSARTNTKMSTKQTIDRSIDSFASLRTPKCEHFYKCNKTP